MNENLSAKINLASFNVNNIVKNPTLTLSEISQL
jgi:hypothetical protein